MDTKLAAMIAEVDAGRLTVLATCARLGISRQTYYKYRSRFDAEGVSGLIPRSRGSSDDLGEDRRGGCLHARHEEGVISSVIVTLEWPRRSKTTFTGTLAGNSNVAWVCLMALTTSVGPGIEVGCPLEVFRVACRRKMAPPGDGDSRLFP